MIDDYKKYKRFFTFGCSFTDFLWPTWVNVLHQDLDNAVLHNYGRSGSGNLQIACKISEAHRKFNFCESDLVMVLWTSFLREDRYVNGTWVSEGNVYNTSFYDDHFLKKYVDPEGFAVRDLALINLTNTMLENLPCKFIPLKSYPFLDAEKYGNDFNWQEESRVYQQLNETYKKMYNSMPISLCEVVYPNFPDSSENWANAVGHTYKLHNGSWHDDPHPVPYKYYQYLKHIGFKLSEKAKNYAIAQTETLKNLHTVQDIENVFIVKERIINYSQLL